VGYLDGIDRAEDDLIRMEARVTIEDTEFIIDFSGSDDQVEEPLNMPFGMTETICKLCFKAVTTPQEDSNAGQYRPFRVIAPEGNLFHATYPAPTFVPWPAMLAPDVIFKALSQALPDCIPASSGGDVCDVMMYGFNPRTGQMVVEANNEGIGWGAARDYDGANALMHVTQSMVKNLPVEISEMKAPVLFDRLELRQDSGGPGKYRGGLGIQRDFRFTHPIGVLTVVQKTKTDGWGLAVGKPGARNAVVLNPGTDKEKRAGQMRGTFQAGDVLSNRSGGGGGFGNPFERDPERVRQDVLDGYVSREAAQEEYGVAITADNQIDGEKTRALRSESATRPVPCSDL
jgi:N-methylhydantoinase B